MRLRETGATCGASWNVQRVLMTSETPGAITEAAGAAAPATGRRYAPGAEPKITAPGATQITVSRGLSGWLRSNATSLAFTSYQTGQLFLVGNHPNGTVSFNQQTFTRARGVGWHSRRLDRGSA